jgi:hypothetical protein
LIAPVRLRRVASGLMIEKVRSTAIVMILARGRVGGWRGAYTDRPRQRQVAMYSHSSRISRMFENLML